MNIKNRLLWEVKLDKQNNFDSNYYYLTSQQILDIFMMDHIFDGLIGQEDKSDYPQRELWTCPQCNAQYKWDIQLLRHERKTKHKNPDRQLRRERRGRRQNPKTQFACDFCWHEYSTNIQLLNHRPWCLNDPRNGQRARSYLSSWNQSQFECVNHEIPQYFSSVQQLQMHISTHKQRHQIKQRQRALKPKSMIIRIRQKIDQQMVERLSKQFRKFRRLSKEQVQRIARAKDISVTTVRRYFKYYKENNR